MIYPAAVMRSATVPLGWIIGCPLLGLISDRLGRRKPVIIGFTIGCGVGALYEAAAGLSSLALPTCLALLAFAICLMRRRLALRNTIG